MRTILKIPSGEVERYKRHGLARVDVIVPRNWVRGLDYISYGIDVSTLLEHSQPVHAWVKETSQPQTLRICIASQKSNFPEGATRFDTAKELKTIDVLTRHTPRRIWYEGPVEVDPFYIEHKQSGEVETFYL